MSILWMMLHPHLMIESKKLLTTDYSCLCLSLLVEVKICRLNAYVLCYVQALCEPQLDMIFIATFIAHLHTTDNHQVFEKQINTKIGEALHNQEPCLSR